MGLIRTLFRRILARASESNLICTVWVAFWHEVDKIIGFFVRLIYRYFVKIDPNKVFFMPQESAYTCNPKYICEALVAEYPDVKVVWRSYELLSGAIPTRYKSVDYNTFAYFREIFSSKIIVANSFVYLGMPIRLKKGQILIQTWHGSLGLKKHSKEVITDSIRRVEAMEYTGRRTDYCLINSTLEQHSLSETYWPKTPMLMYGHARNDLMFPQYAERRAELKKAIADLWGISVDTNIVMYAPTFRNSKSFEYYDIDYDRVADALSERFGGEWCFVLRYHPSMRLLAQERKPPMTRCRLIDATSYFDMQELIAVTDIAITDYSSWIYDFVLTRKPGFLFATDIESYTKKDRGFYYPIETTPFPIARNNAELAENILGFNAEAYAGRVEEFLIDKGCAEDGNAAKRAARLIRDLLDGKPASTREEMDQKLGL